MRIWLNQIDGTCSQVIVSSFEQLVEQCNIAETRFVCQGSHLNEFNFDELLTEDVNVYATGDLDGGKKKKKKKVYTTKKKNKHIHKRVKLGIYTLYSVDGTYPLIQVKGTSLNREKPVPHAAPEPSWLNIGIGTTAASAIPPSRWMLRPSKRTKRS